MKTYDIFNTEMNSAVECMNKLNAAGFTTQFKANEKGLKSLSTETIFKPDEVKVLTFYRFEGDTDPADESILFAIETNTGERGTLIDSYGPDNNQFVTDFIKQVEDFEKNTHKGEPL